MDKLKRKIRVGITMGDPSGIGPAITLKAIQELQGLADFSVIGDAWVLEKAGVRDHKTLNPLRRNPRGFSPGMEDGEGCDFCCGDESLKTYSPGRFNFIDLKNVPHKNFSFGKIKAEYGRASVEYLDKALELLKNKKIDCLVTCPVSKEAVSLSGIDFLGHTEYLAKHSDTEYFVMMLLNKYLKISLATRHIPLEKISSQLNSNGLYKTIYITYQALKSIFSIKAPRIIVCGLNPHASDNGLIGEEENEIIKPVIKRLQKLIGNLDGPLPADVALCKARQRQYDCAVAMYHDQALIPLKFSDAGSGVNITLGLPFIRTSPLHGTAFDIAKNPTLANPASLAAAIKLAISCSLNQREN